MSPDLRFISMLYLDLYVLGDDKGYIVDLSCKRNIHVLIYVRIKGEAGIVKLV